MSELQNRPSIGSICLYREAERDMLENPNARWISAAVAACKIESVYKKSRFRNGRREYYEHHMSCDFQSTEGRWRVASIFPHPDSAWQRLKDEVDDIEAQPPESHFPVTEQPALGNVIIKTETLAEALQKIIQLEAEVEAWKRAAKIAQKRLNDIRTVVNNPWKSV